MIALLAVFLCSPGLAVRAPLTKKDRFCWVWVLRSVMLAVILRYLKKFQFDRCWPWMTLPSSAGLDLPRHGLSVLEAIHGALALPADFERKRRAPSTWTGCQHGSRNVFRFPHALSTEVLFVKSPCSCKNIRYDRR